MVTEMVTACSAACLKFQKLDVNEIWQLTGCLLIVGTALQRNETYSIKDSKGCQDVL